MQIGPPTREAVQHIIENMREWDRREIFATRLDSDTGGGLLEDVFRAGPVAWVSSHEGAPVAAFGCSPMWRGVWGMWMFATDNFPKIGLGMTKFVIQGIVPMLWQHGAHRLECKSMEGHVDAHRWLEVIGARREATHAGYGRDGETFHTYVWEKP